MLRASAKHEASKAFFLAVKVFFYDVFLVLLAFSLSYLITDLQSFIQFL